MSGKMWNIMLLDPGRTVCYQPLHLFSPRTPTFPYSIVNRLTATSMARQLWFALSYHSVQGTFCAVLNAMPASPSIVSAASSSLHRSKLTFLSAHRTISCILCTVFTWSSKGLTHYTGLFPSTRSANKVNCLAQDRDCWLWWRYCSAKAMTLHCYQSELSDASKYRKQARRRRQSPHRTHSERSSRYSSCC